MFKLCQILSQAHMEINRKKCIFFNNFNFNK